MTKLAAAAATTDDNDEDTFTTLNSSPSYFAPWSLRILMFFAFQWISHVISLHYRLAHHPTSLRILFKVFTFLRFHLSALALLGPQDFFTCTFDGGIINPLAIVGIFTSCDFTRAFSGCHKFFSPQDPFRAYIEL